MSTPRHPPNDLLRQARERRLRKTRPELADALTQMIRARDPRHPGVSLYMVKSWERGYAKPPVTSPVPDLLCQLTGLTRTQLGFDADTLYTSPLTARNVETPPVPAEEAATQRRVFLTSTLAVALPAAPLPQRVEPRHVRELTDALSELERQDQLHGAGALVSPAEALLRRGRDLLAAGNYTDHMGRALYSAVGRLAVSTGWFRFDTGDVERARAYYHDGLVAATIGRDDHLTTRTLAILGHHANELGRYREAVSYVQAAQDTAGRWAPPALRALLLSREAAQWAAMGDLQRHQRLAAEAHDVYEPAAADAWFSFVDQGELYTMEGHGLAAGSRFAEAVELFDRAVADTNPARRRNAVSRSLLLARAHVAAGDPTGAVARATPALESLREVNSARLRSSLRQLCRSLTSHQGMAAVKAFDEQARTCL